MSGQNQNKEIRETNLIVKETKAIHQGTTRTGDAYTMYQIVATKPDGTVIDQNLRSFEDLPRDEVLTVTVTPFHSDTYGTSYTLKRKGQSKASKAVDDLRARVERIERHLNLTTNPSPQSPPPPPQQQQQAPPPPPPGQPPVQPDPAF
jgi:hypothetical protein